MRASPDRDPGSTAAVAPVVPIVFGGAPSPRGLHPFVVDRLGQVIASGRLSPGDQIVPEDLGRELGVSRTVVREALRVLESKGMVAARPRTGTRVRPVQDWNLLDQQVILWRVLGPDRDQQLRDLMDLRGAIEPSAALGACTSADNDDVAALLGYCSLMEQAVEAGDLDAFTANDISFHTRLLAASGNLLYRQFIGPVEAVLRARASLQLMPAHVGSVAVSNHRTITQAIRAGDPEEAEQLTRQLVTVARGEIFQALERGSKRKVRAVPATRTRPRRRAGD